MRIIFPGFPYPSFGSRCDWSLFFQSGWFHFIPHLSEMWTWACWAVWAAMTGRVQQVSSVVEVLGLFDKRVWVSISTGVRNRTIRGQTAITRPLQDTFFHLFSTLKRYTCQECPHCDADGIWGTFRTHSWIHHLSLSGFCGHIVLNLWFYKKKIFVSIFHKVLYLNNPRQLPIKTTHVTKKRSETWTSFFL